MSIDSKSRKLEIERSWWSMWKRPLVAVLLSFLCSVQSSMLAMGEWPYMSTIDHDADSTFFGYATAANKASHVFAAFGFALWAHKLSNIKVPMLTGCCITLLACVMYIFVEFIPSNRRWWMFACYLLFGVGFGTSPLLRSYIARVTTEENRSSAYAMLNGAAVLSVVVGPIGQIAFVGLPYPGAVIIPPNIKLNIYTAPIWLSLITNVIAILITIFVLKDHNEIRDIKIDKWSRVRELNLPWHLVALVLFVKLVSNLFNATMAATAGPMFSAMYAYEGEQIVMIMAICQVIVGLCALGFAFSFVLCKLGKRVSCRVLFLCSNFIMIAGYLITYPYPFSSNPMKPYNETTRTGCNPLEYSWCDTQLVVNIIPFLIVMIITSSFALPSASMSLDTIYSKIIGNIDQAKLYWSIMQSIYVVADDIVMILGPIYGSSVFTAIGFNYVQIINGIMYIIATLLWLVAWKWLRPYN